MNKKRYVVALSAIFIAAVVISLALLYVVFKQNIYIAGIVTLAFIVLLLIIYYHLDNIDADTRNQIEKSLDSSVSDALSEGQIGILVYNEEYEVTFMSEFFRSRELDYVGEKLLNWIPELQSILSGEAERLDVIFNDKRYNVVKKENDSVLMFKDITSESQLSRKIADDMPVFGLLSYDNFEESNETEDNLAFINSNIKVPVIEYFKKYKAVYKTLKNHKMLVVMNERIYKQISDDRFSILSTVRKQAKEGNIDLTLSMAFARGCEDLTELDEMAETLLDLAKTRGGDQVVVKKAGEDAQFFGGYSEAREKQNKTKVKVLVNSIKELVGMSTNVIIVGHKDMDADCVGAAICMSNIIKTMDKPVYIVGRSGGIEPMINDVINGYSYILNNKHEFISQNEAINSIIDDNSLVIMLDHHMAATSNGDDLLKKARRIVIIDHHRRSADLDVKPMLLHIEPSASSTCEILVEFLPYVSNKLSIVPEEANIMYLGLLIDTNNFRMRTGLRTYDVAKALRKYGADPLVCDELSQEPYDQVINRSHIINSSKEYRKGVVYAALKEGNYARSIAAQAADTMVKAKEIDASFVICYGPSNEVIVTARSKGHVNVQVIMEKMNGGGHMSAAGLQRRDTTVEKVEEELIQVLNEYFEGENA